MNNRLTRGRKRDRTMRGLGDIQANDLREVLRVYEGAVKKEDNQLADNLRWAHTGLKKQFDTIDKEHRATQLA